MDEDVTNAQNLDEYETSVTAAAILYNNDSSMTNSWNMNFSRLAEEFLSNLTTTLHHHIDLSINTSLTENFTAASSWSLSAATPTITPPPTISATTTATTTIATTTLVTTAATTLSKHLSPQLLANATRHALNVAASAIMSHGNDTFSVVGDDDYDAAMQNYSDLPDRLEHAPQLTKSSLIKVYVLMVMAVLSLIGNVATMWNIYKTRMERRSSRHSWSAIYTLIFHLSIADLIVTGFCIIGDAAWYYTVQWVAGELCCKLVKLFQMFGLYLSTYVLVLIGVDRWIAVKYPMKSLNMAKRCYRLLGGMYVLSLILSIPQYFIFRVKKGPFIEEFHQCVTHGFYQHDWQEQFYTTFTMIFMFFLPLVILFGSYLSTFRTISGSEQMFQGSKLAVYSNKPSMQTNRQRLIHKAKMKSLRISVVIIFAFLICWTPYNVMMILFIFSNPDKAFSEDLQKGIFFFGMANSLVNPLIYGAFHLCPMKRKPSKYSSNPHSLTRGDSQRTPSMLTAVTQVDSNCRSSRTYRQASYYRTHSNGSNYKEHVGLLSTTPTTLKKSASVRSPLPSHQHFINTHQLHHHQQQLQQHQLQLQQQHQQQQQQQQQQLQQPWSVKAGSSCALSGPNGTTITTMAKGTNLPTGSVSLNGLIGPKESISSV